MEVSRAALTVSLLCGSISWGDALAVEYYCKATKKVYADKEYSQAELEESKFATKVEEYGEVAYLSLCSFVPREGKVTCDRYKVDRIEVDKNVKIKKYYVFDSQFDFQIFPSLYSIENNRRGSIQFGKCELTAP